MVRADNSLPNRSGKRSVILQAAAKVFLERGFVGTSMNKISQEARVSKVTVYNHFEDKEALFGAIIEAECEKLTSVLPEEFSDDELIKSLTEFGSRFLDLAMMPQNLSLYRLAVAETVRFPELGRQFYEQGPKHAIEGLTSYLSLQIKKGKLSINVPHIAADHFLGLLLGSYHMEALLGINLKPHKTDWQPHIKQVVEMFMCAYAPNSENTK